MLEVHDLEKRFGAIEAVRKASFSIAKGETFGLLGPNGAGKTTTIEALVGIVKPSAGEIRVGKDGLSPTHPSARERIGFVPQSLALYDDLSANENLQFYASVYGLSGRDRSERIEWALDVAKLTERAKSRVSSFSGGMKRRLNIACGLIHRPELILLDEPTVGVDPQSRNYIFETLERLQREGSTLLYTTHYMEEAQRLCDRIAIMDHGEIVAIGTVEELISRHGGPPLLRIEFNGPVVELPKYQEHIHGEVLEIVTDSPFELIDEIRASGAAIQTVEVKRPSLEDVFLHLTGRTLRDS